MPESSEHITTVACIGVTDAIVPPLIIYSGQQLQESWFKNRVSGVEQFATVSNSGWTNEFIHNKWLMDLFDPYTRERARNCADPRFLFLDGADTHVRVEFMEKCLERNIYLIVIPAHMSQRYQPLDVTFFNVLKMKYHEEMTNFMISAQSTIRVNKGMYWAWHQAAWKATVDGRAIRSGWRDSGLWRLSQSIMCPPDLEPPRTPERQNVQETISTP